MAEEIKRMNFFDGLFLTEAEFNLEQNYHLRSRHQHNKWFHGWGIIHGLDVIPGPDEKTITVERGAALCHAPSVGGEILGREIILLDSYQAKLPDLGEGASTYIYIQYSETEADVDGDKGGDKKIHLWEKPEIGFLQNMPVNDKSKVTLARIIATSIDDTGKVTTSIQYEADGQTFRAFAGFSGKQVETEKLILKTEDNDKGRMAFLKAKPGPGSLNPEHGIVVNSPNTSVTGNISLKGGLHIGSDQEPQAGNLEVEGDTVLSQILLAKGDTIIGDDNQSADLNVKGNLSVSGGPENTGNTLTVSGSGNFLSNVTVKGTGTIQGDTIVGSDSDKSTMTVKGHLQVDGDTEITDTLQVWGVTRIGTVDIPADLLVKGKIQVEGDSPDDQLTVVGKGMVRGDLTVTNSLIIGTTGLKQADSSSNLAVSGGIHVGGQSDPGDNNLEVEGSVVVKNTLNVGDTIQVTGQSTLDGQLTVNQNVILNSGLNVGKTLSVNTGDVSDLIMSGDVIIRKTEAGTGGNLGVVGNCTIDGDLSVIGSTTTINTENLDVKDNIILLNKSKSSKVSPTLESGFEVYRGRNPRARLIWEESSKKWKIGLNEVSLTEISTVDQVTSGIMRDIPVSMANFKASLGQTVFFDGKQFCLALANEETKTGMFMIGQTGKMINEVEHFTLVQAGYIESLPGLTDDKGAGLVAGEYYYVSDSKEGALTSEEPSAISNPIFFAESASSGYVLPFRPNEKEEEEDLWLLDELGNISYPAGFVGIGNINPQTSLDVTGSTKIDGNLAVKGAASITNLFLDGGLHIGGFSNPGDKNLEVEGTALLKGNTNIGKSEYPANLTVEGDLIVNGTTSIFNAANLKVQDTTILLNKNDTEGVPKTLKSGIEVFRGSNNTGHNARLLWHENDQKWKVGTGDDMKALIDHNELTQSLKDIESALVDEILNVCSTGGLAAIVSSLAGNVNVEEDADRHNALLSDPIRTENSLMTSTWGLLLDLFRIGYTMLLEYLDLENLQNQEIGNNTTIHLKGLFRAPNLPLFDERIQERFQALCSNDFRQTCFFLFLHDLLIETPKKAGITYLDTFAQKYRITSERPATWNGEAALTEFLEKIYAPLIKTDSELNFNSTENIKLIIVDCLKNLWQKVITELLLAPEPVFKFSNSEWKKLELEVEKIAEPLGRTLRRYGLVSWWNNPDDIQEIGFQRGLDKNNGNTWLVCGSEVKRIKYEKVLQRWEGDAQVDSLAPLLPDLSIKFTEPILGIRLTDSYLFVILPSYVIYTLPFSDLNMIAEDFDITKSPYKQTAIQNCHLLPSGGNFKNVLFLKHNLATTTGSSIEVFDGEKKDFTASIIFDPEKMITGNNWLDTPSPRIFTLSNIEGNAVQSPYVSIVVNETDHQIFYIGNTEYTPWWAVSGSVHWLVEVHLHPDVSILGTALDQLIINRHTKQEWAFVPFMIFFPERWAPEERDLLAGILKTKMSDGAPLFTVKWFNSDTTEIIYEGDLTLEFQEGRVFDYSEDMANHLISLYNSRDSWVTLFECFTSPLPRVISKIWMGEKMYGNKVAHNIQKIESDQMELIALTAREQTFEYQVATIKK